jgi:very-short-patch-repair endonuclease
MDCEDPWRIKIARRLRREPTDAEYRLWQGLRRSRTAHWRRQAPLLGYIVDFYSSKAKLVVEVDGGRHFDLAGRDSDVRRDAALGAIGVRVLRFDDTTVLKQTTLVLEEVWRICNERMR